jgi:hypothetical protein
LEKGNILKNEENLVRSKKLFQTNTKQVRTESRLQGVLPPLSTNCWSSIENEERATLGHGKTQQQQHRSVRFCG